MLSSQKPGYLNLIRLLDEWHSSPDNSGQEYKLKTVLQLYDTKDNPESVQSKILRFKILETSIAQLLSHECTTDACQIELAGITHNPHFCRRNTACVLEYGAYDPEQCRVIHNHSMVDECFDKFS